MVLEGEDVSSEIRTQEVANAASKVAAFPRVREALRRQRAFRELPGLIADGRDMGTVFPDAPVKIDASADERIAACGSCRKRALMLTLNVFCPR